MRCSAWRLTCSGARTCVKRIVGRGYSFGDRFGIDRIILLRLDVRLHELCRHDADLVPHRLQLARQPLGACARLHADDGAICAFKEGQQCISAELHALDHGAPPDVERYTWAEGITIARHDATD